MKLSIITITYNDEVGFEKTLKSLEPLRSVDAFNWEHIVVDSSPEINSPVLSRFPGWPLTRIETPPRGIYPAFNLGIEHAKGEYLWFLNGGDRLLTVENLMGLIAMFVDEPELDLVCAPVELYRNNKFIYNSQVNEDFISNLVGQNNLCHQGIIYRRSVFDRVGKYDITYKLAGDYDHHLKCYFKGIKFGVFLKPIAQYSRDGRSDNFREVFRDYRKIWRKFIPELGKKMYFRNALIGEAYFLRSKIMKSKLLSPISRPLKDLWYAMHR